MTYKIGNKTVVVTYKEQDNRKWLKWKVVSTNGDKHIERARVSVNGQAITTTDSNAPFLLENSDNGILSISSMGYVNYEGSLLFLLYENGIIRLTEKIMSLIVKISSQQGTNIVCCKYIANLNIPFVFKWGD